MEKKMVDNEPEPIIVLKSAEKVKKTDPISTKIAVVLQKLGGKAPITKIQTVIGDECVDCLVSMVADNAIEVI